MAVLTRDDLKLVARLMKRCVRDVRVPELGECWVSTYGTGSDGYAKFMLTVSPKKVRLVRVHRQMYELIVGPIPEGFHALHKCDVRACCNPRHIFLGKDLENQHDRMEKGKGNDGSRHGRSKLVEEQVKEIKLLIAAGVVFGSIAETYGVSRPTISLISLGKIWDHVEGPDTRDQGRDNIDRGRRNR